MAHVTAANIACGRPNKLTVSADPTRARLERLIDQVIADHGLNEHEKQSAGNFTRKELAKLYDHPKVPQLEAVLRKRITEDEARHILFFPDQDQAEYYQILIANPPIGAPEGHPQRALQIPHLSLLYLQHWKHWDFVSAFVLAGGLHALCSLFTHDNPVVRLKAVAVLVSITAHKDFDWFVAPPRPRPAGNGTGAGGGGGVSSNTTEARLHRALLALRSDPSFIPGLIANSWGSGTSVRGSDDGEDGTPVTANDVGEEEEGGRTFPGACLMCLELLAMWLSWVRALHTVDGTLRLSRPLFRAIKEWAGREGDQERRRRGWDKRRWVPKLPGMKQESDDARAGKVGGELGGGGRAAEATKEDEPHGEASSAAENGGGSSTPGITAGDDDCSRARGGITLEGGERAGDEEHEKEELSDIATAPAAAGGGGSEAGAAGATVGAVAVGGGEQGGVGGCGSSEVGRTPSGDLGDEAEMVMLRAEREERQKVLELVGKLVADFGRFPPAEQDWEEVEEVRDRDDRGLARDENGVSAPESAETGEATVDQGGGGLRVSSIGEGDTEGADGNGGGGTKPAKSEPKQSTDDTGIPHHGETMQNDGDIAGGEAGPAEESPSALTQRALALKIEGNESFRQGRLEEAEEKYTAALSVFDASAGPALPLPPRMTMAKGSGGDSGGAAAAAAAALRGVLYRNRAAAALSLFNSKAAAAAAARDESLRKARKKGNAGGGIPGEDSTTGGGELGDDSVVLETAQQGGSSNGSLGPSPDKEKKPRAEQKENPRLAFESSLALLERCESDCLKAIEVDAEDKKASLRLERCRELRRRCYRGGLASAAAGSGGSSTCYSRQDERLQGRKAELVAKILARSEGTHEIVGGSGGGKSVGGGGDDDGNHAPANAKACAGGPGAIADSSGGGKGFWAGKALAASESEAAGEDARRARQDGAHHAPWEGGTLTAGNPAPPASTVGEAGGTSATPQAASQTGGQAEGGHEKGAPVPRVPSERTGSGTGSGTGSVEGDRGEGGGRDDTRAKDGGTIARKPMAPKKTTKNKKGGERSTPRSSSSRPAKTDAAAAAAAVLSLRRRLEQATERAAAAAFSPAETGHEAEQRGWKTAVVEVWDVLREIPMSAGGGGGGGGSISLKNLFGDGITAESLVGVARSLRYACGLDAARGSGGTQEGMEDVPGNTVRASKLFLQLASVKRVGLAAAMCSPEDRLALKHLSNHVRLQPIEGGGGGPAGRAKETDDDENRRRQMAFESAILTLGL